MTTLVAVAEHLARTISVAKAHDTTASAIAEAAEQARAITGGKKLTAGFGKVVPSMETIKQEKLALYEYLKTRDKADPAKWAAMFVDMQAQLGVCDGYEEVEAEALQSLYAKVEQLYNYTNGQCPKAAWPLAEAIVDTLLKHQSVHPQQQAQLIRIKSAFKRSAP